MESIVHLSPTPIPPRDKSSVAFTDDTVKYKRQHSAFRISFDLMKLMVYCGMFVCLSTNLNSTSRTTIIALCSVYRNEKRNLDHLDNIPNAAAQAWFPAVKTFMNQTVVQYMAWVMTTDELAVVHVLSSFHSMDLFFWGCFNPISSLSLDDLRISTIFSPQLESTVTTSPSQFEHCMNQTKV